MTTCRRWGGVFGASRIDVAVRLMPRYHPRLHDNVVLVILWGSGMVDLNPGSEPGN